MRLIRITVPKGQGSRVAKLAFECGVTDLTVHDVQQHKPGDEPKNKEAVDMHVATPAARAVIEALVRAPFYDQEEFSVDVREPRAVLKSTGAAEITRPVSAPMVDIAQELWQFSHVTYSFVLRVIVSTALLSYGMITENLLLMIGGLIFLPFMPLVLGVAFGGLDRQWKLVAQAAIAFFCATLLIVATAAAVAAVAEPPLMFDKFPPLIAGVLISLLVGAAGALAMADDVGHRQLVGLAAASQIALIPAWFGIGLVFGFDGTTEEKLISFALNALMLILGAAAIFGALQLRANAAHNAMAARRQYKH